MRKPRKKVLALEQLHARRMFAADLGLAREAFVGDVEIQVDDTARLAQSPTRDTTDTRATMEYTAFAGPVFKLFDGDLGEPSLGAGMSHNGLMELTGGTNPGWIEHEDGTVRIFGINSADAVHVSYAYYYGGPPAPTGVAGVGPWVRVQLSNSEGTQLRYYPVGTVSKIEFWAYDGNDTFFNGTLIPSLVEGGSGNDVLTGGSGNDDLRGRAGDDTLNGMAGQDVAYGGYGNDTVNGGYGDDTLAGNDGADVLSGEQHDDLLSGGYGNDTLNGNDGADRLYGDANSDSLYGGSGPDWMSGGSGNDYLEGGSGPDEMYGYGGNDELRGNGGNDEISGGSGDDEVHGGSGSDEIHGQGGDDELRGDSGNDIIYGAGGNDYLVGGDGADQIWGGGNADSLYGSDGDDKLVGDGGDDYLLGWNGDDDLIGGTGNDTMHGGDGNDFLAGQDHADTVTGGNGNDEISGGGGGDDLAGGSGNDSIYGGSGDDELSGNSGNDNLSGSTGDDVLIGGDGDDTLNGGSGNDDIYGGTGDDELDGGSGRDGLFAGLGFDEVTGGSGSDRFLTLDVNGSNFTVWDLDYDELVDVLAEDAEIRFDTGDKNWTHDDVRRVDGGLRRLHHLTGNDNLLERPDATNEAMTIWRRAVDPSSPGNVGRNHGDSISLYDSLFALSDTSVSMFTVHEIGHYWQTPAVNSFVDEFRSHSSWTTEFGSATAGTVIFVGDVFGDGGTFFVKANEGDWWYDGASSFVTNYARTSPGEDFADTLAAVVMGTEFVRSPSTDTPYEPVEKRATIEDWIDSLS